MTLPGLILLLYLARHYPDLAAGAALLAVAAVVGLLVAAVIHNNETDET